MSWQYDPVCMPLQLLAVSVVAAGVVRLMGRLWRARVRRGKRVYLPRSARSAGAL